MADGMVLPPRAGTPLRGVGMTLKVGSEQTGRWSVFEADVSPGFDVGAHRHAGTEELFYVLDGELDLLAFEPRALTGDWTAWESASGATVVRAGPGSLMFVPSGCPHAFANPVRRGPGCSSWPPRPATSCTSRNWPRCSAVPGGPTSLPSSTCGPGTTSSSSPR